MFTDTNAVDAMGIVMYGVGYSVKRVVGEEREVGIEDYDGVIEGSVVVGMFGNDDAPVGAGLMEGACNRFCHRDVVSAGVDAVGP